MRRILPLIFSLLATSSFADEHHASAEKFTVIGTTLIYDTETPGSDIETDDIDLFLQTLRENPGIEMLELNSSGGSIYAGVEIARIVVDFGLDTIVNGECASSCVRIFLAGHGRQMTLGSKIGFHQAQWSARNIQSYYEDWAENEGWDDPFEFAEWMYDDTQREYHEDLQYMLDRGVEPRFAIKSKGIPNVEMWFPTRLELLAAEVLRPKL